MSDNKYARAAEALLSDPPVEPEDYESQNAELRGRIRQLEQAVREPFVETVVDLAEQKGKLVDLSEQCDVSHALATRLPTKENLAAFDAAKIEYSVTRGCVIGLQSVVDRFAEALASRVPLSEGPQT